MNQYHYQAILPNHKGPSIQGVAWGETIKRFYACVFAITGNNYIRFCILNIQKVGIEEVPEYLREIAKRPKFL